MKTSTKALVLIGLLLAGLPAGAQITPEQEKQLFSRVDEMMTQVSRILGMKIQRPVPRAVITREKIREYIEKRVAEALKPEEIRAQEILLKKLGFLPADYDLKAQMVEVLTEQAAAFYDFKQKKLFLASWTPSAMQDMAVVHELAHALADQHYSLEKFIEKSGDDDDAATARGAVVEGQASWVMTEYMARQMGRSLKTSPGLVESAVASSSGAVEQFPVLGKAPLYIQQTLIFPYTQGLLFQQSVFVKLGQSAFTEVFRRPPASSAQILHPELYFGRTPPSKPALSSPKLPGGYQKTMEGTLGELDFRVLLEQYLGQETAQDLAPQWRGGRYALWENSKENRAVMAFAVEWQSPAGAAKFYESYRKICGKKWKQFRVLENEPPQVTGVGDDGRFQWSLRGATFSAMEGLP
jgi:hypothetical protein